jgi:hypothetical protein
MTWDFEPIILRYVTRFQYRVEERYKDTGGASSKESAQRM